MIFFNFFSAGDLPVCPYILCPYWYNDARVYHSVCILSTKSLSIFFLSEKFYTIPHPTYIPRAPSFHSTKILRYAIHAQYNCRGRECRTSGLICSWNLILWGLEARRARSLYLGEWLWGLCVGALLGPFSVLIIRVSEKTTPMGVEARVVYSMW